VEVVKAFAIATLAAAGLGGAIVASPFAHPVGQASPIVDRTAVCAAELSGGIYEVEIRAQAGAVRKGSRWVKPALAMVTTGSTGSAAQALDNAIGWVVAGTPSPDATLIQTLVGVTYPISAWGTVAMSNRCRVSHTRPALSAKGLRGAPVDPFGEVFDCATPRRFLVRVRAVLRTSAALRNRRGYLGTTTPTTEGQVTVSTLAGKRLAYADVQSSGKARLFTAPSCYRD
jgi:hypothetical protein